MSVTLFKNTLQIILQNDTQNHFRNGYFKNDLKRLLDLDLVGFNVNLETIHAAVFELEAKIALLVMAAISKITPKGSLTLT